MHPRSLLAMLACLVLSLVLTAAPAWAAGDQAASTGAEPQAQDQGPHLKWVRFSLGGKPVEVSAGGVLSIHPDAPFRVVKARSDSWIDFGLQVRLAGMPSVNLERFHTLSELLGPKAFQEPQVKVEVSKDGHLLGAVSLQVSLLPIDWLRRAQEATDINDKVDYTQKALELTPDDPLLLMRLVDLMVEAKRYQEAAKLLEENDRRQSDAKSLEMLADLYMRLGQKERAAHALSKLLAERPRDAALIRRLAAMYQELGLWAEAATLLDRLLPLEPKEQRGATYLRLSEVLAKAGRKDESQAALEAAGELMPRNPELWRKLARLRREAGDEAKAIEALQRASQLSPGDYDLHLALADSFMASGQKERAAEELAKAAELRPDQTALLNRLARLYGDLGQNERQVEVYRRLVQQKPDDPDLLYNLAVLSQEREDLEEALDYMERAQAIRPDDQEIRRARLDLLLAMGRWDQAVDLARAMLKEKPGELDPLRAVYGSLAQHRPQALAELLDIVLGELPPDSQLYRARANLALDRDDMAGAIAALEKGVKALPRDPELWFELAALHEANKDTQKALAALGKVLDLKPEYPGAEERYLQLKTSTLGGGGGTGEGAKAP